MFIKNFSSWIIAIINIVFSIAIVGLFLRFFFRLFGANIDAPFSQFLYDSTAPLLYPFRGIFEPYVIENTFILEFTTLIAISIYALSSWLLIELIDFVEVRTIKTQKRRS